MLNETCILVSLRISLPPQTKIARGASEEVEMKYRTAQKQGRVTKSLFSVKDIKPLTQAMNRARTVFNEISLPYDDGQRIIPTTQYFNFMERVGAASSEFDAAKQKFLRNYETILDRAETALGDLYDIDDYPTEYELDAMINFTIESSVIPDVTAFDELAGLTPEAVEKLKEQAVAGQERKVEEALKDLFKRLFKSLKHAQSKLADEKGVFRDTLIGNINGALDAIDSLNLTDNQELKDLAVEVREFIEGVTPEELRKDKDLRAQTAKDAEEALKKVSEFF